MYVRFSVRDLNAKGAASRNPLSPLSLWRMKNSVPLVLGDNEEPGVGTWEVRDTLAPQGRSEWAAGLMENSWPL